MAATEGEELVDDANKRFRDELAKELEVTLIRLGKSNVDLQEVTRSAMALAQRLDECEGRLAEAQVLVTQTQAVVTQTQALVTERDQELAEVQAIVSRQSTYIQRLREQIKDPVRLLAKRVLGPARRIVSKDAGR